MADSQRKKMDPRNRIRKGPAVKIIRPGESLGVSFCKEEHGRKESRISNIKMPLLHVNMNVMDRFFAALLLSPAADFLLSDDLEDRSLLLWKKICKRVGLPTRIEAIQGRYANENPHFEIRAALILEEARASISQSLLKTQKRRNHDPARNWNATVMKSYKSKDTEFRKVSFRIQSFNDDNFFDMRPAGVVLCTPRKCNKEGLENSHLGVVTASYRDEATNTCICTCAFFRKSESLPFVDSSHWMVSPLCRLITELRAFEAMTVRPGDVEFLQELLGNQHSMLARGSVSNECTLEVNDEYHNVEKKFPKRSRNNLKKCNKIFTLPTLNKLQELAASSFLTSDNGTITLIQGPPGTGKTTLLVAVMCRYLADNTKRSDGTRMRLMICAPTNKAVSGLASRFMSAFRDGMCGSFNAVLIGDSEKLLNDESSATTSDNLSTGTLKSIFLYTWMQNVVDDYAYINNFLSFGLGCKKEELKPIYNLAHQLESRLKQSLQYLPHNIREMAAEVSLALKKVKSDKGTVMDIITKLMKELNGLHQENVCSQLMASADIIFCTLSSAGGTVVKKTRPIDDLIVDEAAAAQETELCIPFHARPCRLLLVGDPLQLPAHVLSRRATNLGLAKSLQERLMFDCKFDHIMLDVQYRMRPEIACFPSRRFYESQIQNAENVQSTEYCSNISLLDGKPYTFLQVHGKESQTIDGSYQNYAEAHKVVELVKQWQDRYASKDDKMFCADRIRIISFYQAQVSLIRTLLQRNGIGNKIVVATVDSSQGCEADVVIISFVRCPRRDSGLWAAGFLSDDRRMNVALTRAKHQLICVGDVYSFPKLKGAETIRMLADDAHERSIVCSLDSIKEKVDQPAYDSSARKLKAAVNTPTENVASLILSEANSNIKKRKTKTIEAGTHHKKGKRKKENDSSIF